MNKEYDQLLPADPEQAVLVLEDGQIFFGRAYGATGVTVGELVFNTGMTGYQETLTDPSYHRQIVVMTAPHIGNTGVNDEDPESLRIWTAGFVMRDAARKASSWRARRELADELAEQGVVAISDVDTRAITRHIRDAGAMRAGIFSGAALFTEGHLRTIHELITEVKEAPGMAGANLISEVTTKSAYTVAPSGSFAGKPAVKRVVAVDMGIKSMTPQRLAERGVEVQVVPADVTFEEITALSPDGVFFSNGPGDPSTADAQVALLRQVLDANIPFFGICFGNQILGRALGFDTYKLRFGHRGLNQPVQDLATGKVEITSQNHGFAVKAEPGKELTSPFENGKYGKVRVSHVGMNDNVVEGLECQDIPAFSVQYHPEAAAGPHDASYLFDRFLSLMVDGTTTAAGLSAAKNQSTDSELEGK